MWRQEMETLKSCTIQKYCCSRGTPTGGGRRKDRTIRYLGRDKGWSPAQFQGGKFCWNTYCLGLKPQQDMHWDWRDDCTLVGHLGESENLGFTLAGVAQCVECRPGCIPGPQLGASERGNRLMYLSHIVVSLSLLFLPFPLSKKK